MSRKRGYSKPTPTPLNGLATNEGKTRRKVIEGKADSIIRQTTRQKPAAYRKCGGKGRRKRRYGKTNRRQNPPPAYRQRGGEGETKKGELKENAGAKQGKPTSKPSRRLPSWRLGETKRRKPTRNGKMAQPTAREGGKCLAEIA